MRPTASCSAMSFAKRFQTSKGILLHIMNLLCQSQDYSLYSYYLLLLLPTYVLLTELDHSIISICELSPVPPSWFDQSGADPPSSFTNNFQCSAPAEFAIEVGTGLVIQAIRLGPSRRGHDQVRIRLLVTEIDASTDTVVVNYDTSFPDDRENPRQCGRVLFCFVRSCVLYVYYHYSCKETSILLIYGPCD